MVTETDQPFILKADLDGKLVLLAGNAGFGIVSFHNKPKAVMVLSAPDLSAARVSLR